MRRIALSCEASAYILQQKRAEKYRDILEEVLVRCGREKHRIERDLGMFDFLHMNDMGSD